MRKRFDKKGQMSVSLPDGPMIVMIVGFVFLMMATIAYIGGEYQDSLSLNTYTVVNETLEALNETVQYVNNYQQCEFQTFAVSAMTNATEGNETVDATNYTIRATDGAIYYSGGANDAHNNTLKNITYTYQRAGTACNVTDSLATELDDNTSIAGIVLTISLVGIVLSVLIGIFVATRRRGL